MFNRQVRRIESINTTTTNSSINDEVPLSLYQHSAFDISSEVLLPSSIFKQSYPRKSSSSASLEPLVQENGVDYDWLIISCIEEALSFFFEWVPTSIIMLFMTSAYSQEISSGYGLGQVWLNCMGLGLYYGLGSGLETMAAHANGAQDYNQVGQLFQKTLVVMAAMLIPICLLMIFASDLLFLWNDNHELCEVAGKLCIYAIPGIISCAFYYALKAILNAQNEFRIQVYSSGISVILVILYCFIFISVFDYEIYGAAICFSLFELTNLLICLAFVSRKIELHRCFSPFTKECLRDIPRFLKTAIPIGSLVSLEWILQEVNAIIASSLPGYQFSANIVLSNLTATCVQFPLGYSTAACTFIGNEMGKGNVRSAKKYAKASAVILIIHLAVTNITIFLTRSFIAQAFAVELIVQEQINRMIFIMMIVYTLDSIQSLVTAFMRAIAKEKFSSLSFIISYACLGLTTSYILAHHTQLQVVGIWYGSIISLSVYLVLQAFMIFKTDLTQMARLIADRMSEGSDTHSTCQSETGSLSA